MNSYNLQRGHSWNPYNCNLLPNRVATLSDVRYRSFQAPQISSRSAKSRASLALPNYNSNFGSSHQLAPHFHEHHHHHAPHPPPPPVPPLRSHHELMRAAPPPPPCYAPHCCGCPCSLEPPPFTSLPNAYSTYELNNGSSHCNSCGTCLVVPKNSRLYSKNHRSSQRYIKQDPWEPVHERSKSLRWTKEQLEKFDNLVTANSKLHESSSSSSGDNSTDDSGIHSKSTSKDSPRLPPKSIIKYEHPVKIDRVAVGRKPVRKLPAVPNSKQAHIVQLKTEPKKSSPRTLPKPPNDENSSPIKKGLRLTNFFRSVKFPKNKKIQPAPVRIFGRDLSELAKATNLEVPEVLTRCTRFVEDHGTVDGIYRISGIASNIKKLRNLFETKMVPQVLHTEDWIIQDIHCVPSVIKLFFRELPEPLCPEKMYQLLRKGITIASGNSDSREALPYFKEALHFLSSYQYKTLKHLMTHLQKVSGHSSETGMSSKNLAIVWAPNLLRTPLSNFEGEHSKLQSNLVQNTLIVQYMIDNAQWLFEAQDIHDQKKKSVPQLPPQYLERVKVIHVNGNAPISLSKRYTSAEHMNDINKKTSVVFGALPEVAPSGIRRMWHHSGYGHQRPLSMDLSDVYTSVLHADPNCVSGSSTTHISHHHPVTHRHIHQQPVCVNNLHVSDV